jgi:hypothetical protein
MYWIDPLQDARWASFVERHPRGSVFHTPAWLGALSRTYGYQPVALTSCSPQEELSDGMLFCEVKSWISGSRLVSLPFSDHCQPLLGRPEDLADFISCLRERCGRSTWKYVEVRTMESSNRGKGVPNLLAETEGRGEDRNSDKLNRANCNSASCQQYNFHKIDLRPDIDKIFSKFHKGCIQRKIKRADREKLHYEAGRSESSLQKFYSLLLLTRRRHGLPPQPMAWFRNLIECFGENLTIRIASKDGRPIGSILALSHKNTVVYKYGCSDSTLHRMGAMPMLFWKAIQEAKQRGVEELDLGRSEIDNPGLGAFKEHLGATCSKLAYFRLGRQPATPTASSSMQLMRTLFTRLPSPFSRAVGAMLYKHIG